MFTIYLQTAYGPEEVDTAETKDEAEYLVQEYRLAYGDPHVYAKEKG